MIFVRKFDSKLNIDIQILRGLAVIAVVLFHLNTNFQNGYLGVDIFFVVSGFLILPKVMQIFPTQTSSSAVWRGVKTFLTNRFWRLFPALSITLTSTSLLLIFLGPVHDLRNFAKSVAWSYFGLGNYAAYHFTADYFSPNVNPLTHTWSLAVEEQIYIFVPIFLFLLHRWKFRQSFFYLSLSILGALSFLLSSDFTARYLQTLGVASWSNLNYYLTASRFWEFLVGGLCATICNRGSRIFREKYVSFLSNSIFCLLLIVVLFPVNLPRLNITLLVSLLTATMLFLTARKDNQLLLQPLLRILGSLGNISYSVYLVHLPVIYLFQNSPHLPTLRENPSVFTVIFLLIVIISSSLLLHFLVETRFRQQASKSSLPAKVLILAGPLGLFSAILIFLPSAQALDPNLPPAGNFKPWDWDRNCKILSEPDGFNNPFCSYGSPKSEKRILLIGDSHAATISQHFARQARQENYSLIISTFAGCGFINPDAAINSKFRLSYYSEECKQHNKTLLGIIKDFNPTIIVISRHSSSSMIEPNTYESRLYYNQLLLDAIRHLPKQKFVVIGSVPEYSSISTLGAYLMNQEGVWSDIPFQDKDYWQALDEHNLKYFDTLSLFCPGEKCESRSSKGYYFVDESHLSSLGGKILFIELEDAGFLDIEP